MLKVSLLSVVACLCILSQVQSLGLNKNWPVTFEYWSSHIVNTLSFPECVFFRNEHLFGCGSAKSNILSCEADFNFTGLNDTLFNSFGIGLDMPVSVSIPVTEKYFLYPRILDYTDYMSYYVTLHGKQSLFALYQDSKYDFFGVRIRDGACFQKLIEYFTSIVKMSKNVDLMSYSMVPFKAYIFSNLYVV